MHRDSKRREALLYHAKPKPGKIAVVPTKPTSSQRDLSLAYSPGVAEPCLEIAKDKNNVYKYTAKGNLVAVISNGTAVLGLGDIGPEASKPVMEGKGLLFKIFSDIDVFDIEIDTKDIDAFIETVKNIAPTFGGINLEDIKAPESFEIERRLIEELDIPVMHDDQHGTAIISAAALLNALELSGKKIEEIKVVVSGAGSAALACSNIYLQLGVKVENIVMFDANGVLHTNRTDLLPLQMKYAKPVEGMMLAEAVNGADMFLGLSAPNVLTPEMLLTMNENPIVFAMANPVPEIDYELAINTRSDIIMATGRSDFPNQVNNVLGFPYIFRGALDVRATSINEEMKIAAVYAIAELTKSTVPEAVNEAYEDTTLHFGREYIIPKPTDPRLITAVAPAVARAAMETGVARQPIEDWDAYNFELRSRLGLDDRIVRDLTTAAKADPKRVVFTEADSYKILKAAHIVREEGIAEPILLGNRDKINQLIESNNLHLPDVLIIDPFEEQKSERFNRYVEYLYKKRQRRGITEAGARKAMLDRNYFAACMVEFGEADTLISGLTKNYASAIRPALQVIGTQPGSRVAGMYMMLTKKGPVFFGDTTVNVDPSVEELVDISVLLHDAVKRLNIKPRLALLSYTNFGS